MDKQRQCATQAWVQLVRTYQKMDRCMVTRLNPFDLTVAQFDVLVHLSIQDGITQQELANQLLVTKGNVCGLIDRLVERGYVERRNDPSDRRANQIYLTPEGHKKLGQALPEVQALFMERMAVLSMDEQQTLYRLLCRLDHALDAE